MSGTDPHPSRSAGRTVFPVLIAISFSHLLNDSMQSLIPAIYPLVKDSFALSFAQIGLITFTFQIAASLLQPGVGILADIRPRPFSLSIGMGSTLAGLVLLSLAGSFPVLLVSVAMIGIGSSVFHPESSRVAYMASGQRRGLAQSVFQVGGNVGSSFGPLFAALVVTALGRSHVIWFSLLALLAMGVLWRVGLWYRDNATESRERAAAGAAFAHSLPRGRVVGAIAVLLVLIFSKFFYLASVTSYYTFYLMDKFGLQVHESQLYLFVFQFAVAAGTLIGGPIGDRIGRKYVIWLSILGAAPFALILPHAGLALTCVLAAVIGVILSSAFPSILVYAQELLPGRLGLVSGLFFGFAFGMGGLGSALLGRLADLTSISYVYKVCAFLPLIGLLTIFLPNLEMRRNQRPSRRPAPTHPS